MKRFLAVAAMGLLLPVVLWAQGDDLLREERIYKTIGGQELRVDVFSSPVAGGRAARPAMAFFHGGGWAYGERSEFHEACVRYSRKGFVTLSFQYRLSINPDETVPHPDTFLCSRCER